jgi:hypothetical protein
MWGWRKDDCTAGTPRQDDILQFKNLNVVFVMLQKNLNAKILVWLIDQEKKGSSDEIRKIKGHFSG